MPVPSYENKEDKGITYNAAGEIKDNIVLHFRKATYCMQIWNMYEWYKALEAAYMEAMFKFKPNEREECDKLFKSINPYIKASYPKLKELQIKLRDLCYKYEFFTMAAGGDPRTAVWR